MYSYNVNAPLKNVAVSTADLITPHPSPRWHLPLKLRRGRHFRGASALIPIRFLRQPDRKVPTKP